MSQSVNIQGRSTNKKNLIKNLFRRKSKQRKLSLSNPAEFVHLHHVEGSEDQAYTKLKDLSSTEMVDNKLIDQTHQSSSKYCRALVNRSPDSHDELTLKKGDIIQVLQESDNEWWIGCSKGEIGMFSVRSTCIIK